MTKSENLVNLFSKIYGKIVTERQAKGATVGILQHIQTMTGQLAESEAKVAQAILADPRLLEHYTITSLAQHAGTSTSAVLRFCRSMGYAGFKEFRYELNAEQQKGSSSDEEADGFMAAAEGLASAIRKLGELDRALVEELATHIAQARTVFCLGVHRSALPAIKLRMDLEDLGILAVSVDNATYATHIANLVGANDCTVIFSETGAQSSYRPALDAGLTAQGHTWLVSSNLHPQLAAHTEHVVTLPSARRAGAGLVDEHPVAMAFVELLTLKVREQLQVCVKR